MIQLKKYQEEAVNELSTKLYRMLQRPSTRQNLIFKAPTGAGKTVMIASLLNKVCEEYPERFDLEKRKAAFIWIAPNKLYIQSYNAIKGYFSEMRSLKPIFYEDISDALQSNEILFVNWESINKEKNTAIKETETGKNLYNFINKAKYTDTEIIVIIDEEHMFASAKTAKRAAEVLQKINAKVEIRVSATPTTNSDYKVIVERGDVIEEEMIKSGITLNPALHEVEQDGRSLDVVLLQQAINKTRELKVAYDALGVNINPLLLIQLPNDESEEISSLEQQYIDVVLNQLETNYGITLNNHKLAIWLSNRKENLTEIEAADNMVEVLLFKQAVALGWDCPRAGVLLIYREIKSTTFTIQTVGRILRMPEQKHYTNPLLNQGYVYTNLSKDKIEIVKDDMNYITMNKAYRIENYARVMLNSAYINRKMVRNRLGSDFRKALYQIAETNWELKREMGEVNFFDSNKEMLKKKFISLDVTSIDIVIPENIHLTGGVEIKEVNETARFAKTIDELNQIFRQFCRANIGQFAPVDSTPVLEIGLKLFFEEYFGYNEYEAIKIILFQQNQPLFITLIEKSLDRYTSILEERSRKTMTLEHYDWEVPVERVYNDLYEEAIVKKHALVPFFQKTKVSNPEREFAAFLEENKNHLQWWYKNGETAKEHFAVPYINHKNEQALFYVDFVIMANNGMTCLFDTKSKGSDAADAYLKHNGLVDFIAERNLNGLPTIGGVIINKEVNNNPMWRYCSNKIENTDDLTGWSFFNPAELNNN